VKILLQSLETLGYSCGEADWTPNPGQAQDFFEVVHALDYAMRNGFDDVRVVIKFEDALNDVELPPMHLAAGRATH
jgi:hypothetical protein